MREAFDAMGDHPFVTFFMGLIFIFVVREITEIFKKPKEEDGKNESE